MVGKYMVHMGLKNLFHMGWCLTFVVAFFLLICRKNVPKVSAQPSRASPRLKAKQSVIMDVTNNVTYADADITAHVSSVVEVVAFADAVRAGVDSTDDITFSAAQTCAVPLADTVSDIGKTDCLATHPVIEKNNSDEPSGVASLHAGGNVSVPVSLLDGVRAYDSFGVICRPPVVYNEVAPTMVDAVRTSSFKTVDAPHSVVHASDVSYKTIDEVAAGQTRVDQRRSEERRVGKECLL